MFIKDPCGIICLLLTYVAVFYADYVIINWVVLQTMFDSLWGTFHVVVFNVIILFLTMAHIKAVMTDPGIIPLPKNKFDFSDMPSLDSSCEYANWTVCARCETFRPPRAHHCRICQRCIRRMDHHCPWINNCVGERNQKFFIQFLVFVGLLAIYTIALVGASWMQECSQCPQDELIKHTRILHSIIVLVESALFGMFVGAILFDQLQAIMTDETAVEQIQNRGPYRPHKPKLALLREVCGRGHPLCWLLPCSAVPRKYDSPLIDHHV